MGKKLGKTIVICIGTNKGGAGKSTANINLAYSLSDMGYKVLAIDTDPQMNSSQSVFSEEELEENSNKNFYYAFRDREDIRNHIIRTKYENLDFVLADVQIARLDTEILQMFKNDTVVLDMLRGAREEGYYDFIFIDQNSSLSLLNKAIISASDEIIIPVEPSIFGVKGIALYLEHFDVVRSQYNHINILGILFNKVDKRENVTKDARFVVEAAFGDKLFKTYIPVDSNIKNSQWGANPIPVAVFNKSSRAAESFYELAKEVVEIVKNR